MNTQTYRQTGFTLLEVLVAMSILFLAVSTGLLAFQSNQQATSRAVKLTHVLTHVDAIVNAIQPELGIQSSAQGRWLGIHYTWQAETLETRPARLVSATSGSGDNASREFSLYAINLSLEYKGLHREFYFEELAWRDLD